MIDSGGAADQPVRLGGRTRRGVLAWIGLGAVAAGVLEFVGARSLIVQGFDWVDPVMLLIPILVIVAVWLVLLGSATEWTIAGRELRRRGWLSRPGSEPAAVLELGPQFEIVHETRSGWRIRPHGPAIYVTRGQAAFLISTMERAGVCVIDWRGDWASRHRTLDRLAVPMTLIGGAGLLVTVAQGPLRAVGFEAYCLFWGFMMLGWAIDFLPWRMRKPSTRDA